MSNSPYKDTFTGIVHVAQCHRSEPELGYRPVVAPFSSSGKRVTPDDSVAHPSGDSSPGDPDHKRQRRQGSPAAVAHRTPTSSVNEGNLATSQDTAYDPGVDAAPSGAPHGSGAPLARRAEQEEAAQPLDSRAASFVEFLSLRSRVRSVSDYVADVDRSSNRLANDLGDVERRVGWLESPQATQQRAADLERQVAQLQVQLDRLVRMQRMALILWQCHPR
ncbi:hypothetical protein F444_05207 [Phytophthora nicotianae P1976]|uniref:Uncharacterized protein n=1 Tax=Phytophthora nicotianae P1976 TaxID=1317066 RepID=A0A081AMV8_PHYNI|nr:hypothetical protein F444_05207 [Phytophthora nicotianae P1976]